MRLALAGDSLVILGHPEREIGLGEHDGVDDMLGRPVLLCCDRLQRSSSVTVRSGVDSKGHRVSLFRRAMLFEVTA